ncbi:MAG: adenylyltransferase/cytidyltransferase family protein [Nanoarchaeota archaeon]
MVVINIEDLPGLREKYKGRKIVFCSGGFDLTHAGHIIFFEDCKKLGDILVVGVGRDASLRKRKGDNRPILNEHIRLKTIDSLKPVDYVFINSEQLTGEILGTVRITFENLHPDIYVVNEDAFDIPTREKLSKENNVKMVVLPRWYPPEFEGISTSKIIDKVKKLP